MRPVAVTKEGGFAVIRPPYLGETLFGEYRKAVEGARYDRTRKASVATFDKLPGILRRLREMDLRISCADEVVRALAEHDAKLWLDTQGARERVTRFDEELHKSGKALYPFQGSGAVWLAPRHGALLADQMGLGKTVQCIAALPPGTPCMVVCPATLKRNWQAEIRKFRPSLKTTILDGRGSFRWPEPGEVVLVNYDILPDVHTKKCLAERKDKDTKVPGKHTESCERARRDPIPHRVAAECTGCYPRCKDAKECRGCVPFLKACPPDLVLVFDEAHKLKNSNAQRTVKARGLSWATREAEGRVWLLTGTPLLNEPMELWSLLQSAQIAEEVFGDFKTFLRCMGGKAEEYGFSFEGAVESEEVRERLERVMLRRLKEEVMSELPRKTIQDVPVEIDAATIRACNVAVKDAGGVAKIVANLEKALSFSTMSSARESLAKAKIPALLEIVEAYEEAGTPLLVFSAHRAPIDIFEKREGWKTITGDTSLETRARTVEEFQAEDSPIKGVALTIRAGGEGVTLTRASDVVFVDEEWSPGQNEQAQDRVHRISQTRPVLVKRLVAEHDLDKHVAETLARKARLIRATVDQATEEAHEEDQAREEVREAAQATEEVREAAQNARFGTTKEAPQDG